MHKILALSMEKLHFESFLETFENVEDTRSLIMQELWIIKEQKNLEKDEWSQETEELLAAYISYKVETIYGKRGKAAKYWIKYVNMIHLYHEFSRTIHTLELFLLISSSRKITISLHSINQTMIGGQ